tara:strand:+ start:4309 stop:4584 length:276 start_codon:yes stop_codon:yes gene_type:complete
VAVRDIETLIEEKIHELEQILGLERTNYTPMREVVDMYFDGDDRRARLFFYGIGVFQRGFISKDELYDIALMANASRGLVDRLLENMGVLT